MPGPTRWRVLKKRAPTRGPEVSLAKEWNRYGEKHQGDSDQYLHFQIRSPAFLFVCGCFSLSNNETALVTFRAVSLGS